MVSQEMSRSKRGGYLSNGTLSMPRLPWALLLLSSLPESYFHGPYSIGGLPEHHLTLKSTRVQFAKASSTFPSRYSLTATLTAVPRKSSTPISRPRSLHCFSSGARISPRMQMLRAPKLCRTRRFIPSSRSQHGQNSDERKREVGSHLKSAV
jgi:hypothetical protein